MIIKFLGRPCWFVSTHWKCAMSADLFGKTTWFFAGLTRPTLIHCVVKRNQIQYNIAHGAAMLAESVQFHSFYVGSLNSGISGLLNCTWFRYVENSHDTRNCFFFNEILSFWLKRFCCYIYFIRFEFDNLIETITQFFV